MACHPACRKEPRRVVQARLEGRRVDLVLDNYSDGLFLMLLLVRLVEAAALKIKKILSGIETITGVLQQRIAKQKTT